MTIDDTLAPVRTLLASRRPAALVVLGSGLGGLAARLEHASRLPYRDIPGFHEPTVPGHAGELIAGRLAGRDVLVQSGRFHLYEGHDAATSALPVRIAAALGIGVVLLTNAAGGIRRTFRPGTLMLIADTLNLTFRSPLIGPVHGQVARFPDMSSPWDSSLRGLAREVAAARGVALEEGVYAGVLGPSYETPAEIRMLDRFGADAVGMSTVSEVTAARAAGLRCLGVATITNMAAGLSARPLSHDEVMEAATVVGAELGRLLEGVVARLP